MSFLVAVILPKENLNRFLLFLFVVPSDPLLPMGGKMRGKVNLDFMVLGGEEVKQIII